MPCARRDAEQIGSDEYTSGWLTAVKALNKRQYPILCSKLEKAVDTANEFLETAVKRPT
jgi:hypothetical protein